MVENKVEDLVDLPPGFRFHPTDEEIITHYLNEKVINNRFSPAAIGEADLNKSEPWDLPKKAKMRGENECYFFCQKDRKYSTGMRTNRATEAGYWKATGKDKEIYRGKGCLVGMKKTLVFYKGRAPKGEKTNWVMHEYRLEGKSSYYNLPKSAKDEWVVCRVYHKTTGTTNNNPMGDLLRMNSFDDITNLFDNSSVPPLGDPNYSGLPGSSYESKFQLPTTMNDIQTDTDTNFHQTSINTIVKPRATLQNTSSSYNGTILGSSSGLEKNEVLYKAEPFSWQLRATDVVGNNAEISSKQTNIIESSQSYDDFADLVNILEY